MQVKRTGTIHASRMPLTILVADASHLLTYAGLRAEHHRLRVTGRPDAAVHFSGTIAGVKGAPIEWDGGCGLLADLGEPAMGPVIEIYRAGTDLIVGAAHFGPRDGDIARASSKLGTEIGDVEITSGALAITSAPEPPVKLTRAKLDDVEIKGSVRFYWGILLRVDPGPYRVAHETVEREGSDQARLRISRPEP